MRTTEKRSEDLRKWGSARRERAGAGEGEGQMVRVHLVFSLDQSDSAEPMSLLLTPFLHRRLPAGTGALTLGHQSWEGPAALQTSADTPATGG